MEYDDFMPSSEPTFESALEQLQGKVKALESGDLPLEEALRVFEEGVRMSRFCQEKLAAAERRIDILLKEQSGGAQPRLEPFDPSKA